MTIKTTICINKLILLDVVAHAKSLSITSFMIVLHRKKIPSFKKRSIQFITNRVAAFESPLVPPSGGSATHDWSCQTLWLGEGGRVWVSGGGAGGWGRGQGAHVQSFHRLDPSCFILTNIPPSLFNYSINFTKNWHRPSAQLNELDLFSPPKHESLEK